MRVLRYLASAAAYAALASLPPAVQLRGQQPAADNRPPASITLRYEYTGFYDGSGTYTGERESCPSSRRDGRLVVEGSLRYNGGEPPGDVRYEGSGRITANVDVCDLKPGTGKYLGTHEYCNMTVVTSHDVTLIFEVKGLSDPGDEPREANASWKPRGPVAATVTGDCEPKTLAQLRGEVTAGTWAVRTWSMQPTGDDEEVMRRMTRGGVPRPGRYEESPSEGSAGRWVLTIGTGPADDVRIAIEGPKCACLEGEVAAPKVADYTARASERGGTFAKWVVAPEGDAPGQLVNSGGATGTLSLGVTRATRRFTLSIAYTRGGRTYRSEPYPVTVCVVDSISTPDGAKDISFDDGDPGRAVVELLSQATVAGRDASEQIRWTIEGIDDGTTLTPSEATGAKASFTYEQLPTKSTSFGTKKATLRVEAEGCACTRAGNVRIFYAPFATNHPQPSAPPAGTDTPTPNWFYYWMQTSAGRGVDPTRVVYRTTIAPENIPPAGAPPPMINGRYEEGADRVLIAGRVPIRGACRARMAKGDPPRATGVTATGIDCFAETLRHEWHHRVEYLQWWSGGYDRARDLDGDRVPNGVEDQEPGCSRVSPLSCQARPFPDATDRELNAYWVGWTWQPGSASSEDWTCQGKQWRGKRCPIPGSLPP